MSDWDNIWLKVQRADKHIDELHFVLREFINSNPYGISAKINPQTRERIYYLAKADPIPPVVSLIIGDVLQNLRSALDHLACSLVRRKGKEVTDAIGFPIFNQFPLSQNQRSTFSRKVNGMGYRAIRRIKRVEPYKGRNHRLWVLHELNRIDKHRLLIPVGAAVAQFNLGQHLRKTRRSGPLDMATDLWIGRNRVLLVEAGQELIVDPPDTEVNQEIQFIFDVVINESGICEGEPVIVALRTSYNTVRYVLRDFKDLF